MADAPGKAGRTDRFVAFARRRPFEVILTASLLVGALVASWPVVDTIPSRVGAYIAWALAQEECSEVPVYEGSTLWPPDEDSRTWRTPRYDDNPYLISRAPTVEQHLRERLWNSVVGGAYDGPWPPDLLEADLRRLERLTDWHDVVDSQRFVHSYLGQDFGQRRWNPESQRWEATILTGYRDSCHATPIPSLAIAVGPDLPRGFIAVVVVFVASAGLVLSRRALNKPSDE